MIITIDFSAEEPIYMQIRNAIVTAIASGALHDGDMLPSVRTLGSEIGVNLHTVNKAYKLLQSEGFVDLLRNHSTVIRVQNTKNDSSKFIESVGVSLHTIISEAISRGVKKETIHKMVDNVYKEIGGNLL